MAVPYANALDAAVRQPHQGDCNSAPPTSPERALSRVCLQVLWQASIYLEAVAVLPQLTLIMRTRNVDNLTSNYMALLGSYRAFYILNWIYRYYTEYRFFQPTGASSAGLTCSQT